MSNRRWEVVIDRWLSEWTYGVYTTERDALTAMLECSPDWGTPRIRRGRVT